MISTQFIGVGMLLAVVLLICFGLAFFLHTKMSSTHHRPTSLHVTRAALATIISLAEMERSRMCFFSLN